MSDHPTQDAWERLAAGELDPGERQRVMAHVAACPACARTWRVARDMANEGTVAADVDAPVDAPAVRPRWRSRVRRALYLTGGSALGAAALLVLWLRSETKLADDDVARPGRARGSTDEEVVLVGASATRLAWRPVQGAQHYRVEVFTREGALVWARDEVATSTVEVAPPLPAGQFLWHVEAWVRGARTAVAAPGRFGVTDGAPRDTVPR